MPPGTPNSMNGRRHGLAQADARLLAAQESGGQTPAFRFDVRRSLRMHPLLAGIVAGVVFLLLVGYALSRKPVYSAESLIYVEPLEVRVLSDGSSSGYDPSRYDSYLQQQVQTVERADTLEAALAKLPTGMWSAPGENPAAAVPRLESALKVERVLNSYQLAIDVTASNAESAAAAANAITSAYLEEGRKDEHTRADQRQQLLIEERQRITDDMSRDKAEQASLGTSLGVANPTGASGNPYDTQTEGLRSQLAAAREAHDTVAAQLASVSGANGSGLDTAANELITTDPALVSIKQTLSQRRAVLSDQMAGLTPANPVYKQDQEEIAALDRSMDRATADARQRAEGQLQNKLRLDLRRTSDVEGRLNAQLAEQTAKATGAGPKLQRAAELDTDLQRLGARYATVDDAIRGLQLETSGPGQAHLVLAARTPDEAKPGRTKLILLLALPLSLLCGLAAAVIARKRDPRLYLAADLQDVLGFAPMCVLPNLDEVSGAAYDEFLLRLAGGLEGAYRHGRARSFVFTSASVTASADALVPKLCLKLQQIGFRAGCMPAEVLLPAAVSQPELALSMQDMRGREGVAATQMERFLQDHDMVLIQAPPLLGSALTEYAVRCADATILLVESTRTDREELRRAATLLERINPQGIGAVLEGMPLQYADSGFLAAVRAADWSSRHPVEGRGDVRPLSEKTRPTQAEKLEVVDMSSRHGSKTVAAQIAGSLPAGADRPAELSELARPPLLNEPAKFAENEEEGKAPKPASAVAPIEPSVSGEPAFAGIKPGWVAFSEVAEPAASANTTELVDGSGDANEVDDALSRMASEPVASPSSAEGERVAAAVLDEKPLTSNRRSKPLPARGWAAWNHVDAEPETDAIVEEQIPAESSTDTSEPSDTLAAWSARREAPKPSPFQSEEPVDTINVSAPIHAESRPSVEPVPTPAPPASVRAEQIKPTSWWRRLLHVAEEPVLAIAPKRDDKNDNDVETEDRIAPPPMPASSQASPSGEDVRITGAMSTAAFSGESAVEEQGDSRAIADRALTPTDAEPWKIDAPQRFSETLASEQTFADPAHAEQLQRVESAADEAGPTAEALTATAGIDLESISPTLLERPAPPSYTDQPEAVVLTPLDAGRAEQAVLSEATELWLPVAPASETLPPVVDPAPAMVSPLRPNAAPGRSAIEAELHRALASGEHVAADPKGPLGTFPRHRPSPITIAAIPSMVTSASVRSTHEEAGESVRSREPAKSPAHSPEPQAPRSKPEKELPTFRAGLARAVAQVTAEDGPPARASEGLTAMRTGAGLRRAIVRGEAARSQILTPEPAAQPQGEPGMSRRWAMLSRFERNGSDAPLAEDEAQSLARTAASHGRTEAVRKSRV